MTERGHEQAGSGSQETSLTSICQGCGAPFRTRQELQLHNLETHGGGSTGGSVDEPPGGGGSDGSAGQSADIYGAEGD